MKKHYSKFQKFSYRTSQKLRLRSVQKISSSSDAHEILRQYWTNGLLELQEEFKVMLLNRYNKVIGIFTASSGGIASTVADPKLIFGCALKAAASGIILAHNHPSGCLQASQADLDLTKKLRDGGNLLDIQTILSLPAKLTIHSLMKGFCSPSSAYVVIV